jgi:hypothetical protein
MLRSSCLALRTAVIAAVLSIIGIGCSGDPNDVSSATTGVVATTTAPAVTEPGTISSSIGASDFIENSCFDAPSGRGTACVSGFTYEDLLYEVMCGRVLRPDAVGTDVEALGSWARSRTEIRAIADVPVDIAVAIRSPGGCAAAGTWLLAVVVGAELRIEWIGWIACTSSVTARSGCGVPPA